MSTETVTRRRGPNSKTEERHKSMIEDIEFLVANDVPGDLIAERMGYSSIDSLKKVMYRCARYDLVAKVTCSGDSRPGIRQGRVAQ